MPATLAEAPTTRTMPPESKSVLHVSSAHRVSDGRISRKEATALSAAGYDVTVMGLERAGGTVLPHGPRFVEYDAPAARRRRFLIRLPWLLGYCFRHRYDIYHLHDPDLIPLGIFLKLLGRRVVYDVHESYPMVILDRDWIPRPLRPLLSRAWRSLETAFVRWADLTVAAHDTVKQQFAHGNLLTVHNYPILEDLAVTKSVAMAERPCRVIYHGDLTVQRGLFTMIEAMAKVDLGEEVVLRLCGSLPPALHEKIVEMPGMQRTAYLGWTDGEKLAEELSHARAGLILLHPTNNYKVIRPNKLYEYMAAGLPVIASDFSHWREIVGSVNCGILVDPLDTAAIARAIEYLITHPDEAAAMGERGRQAAVARYNWQNERHKLIAGYERAFGPAHEPARRSA